MSASGEPIAAVKGWRNAAKHDDHNSRPIVNTCKCLYKRLTAGVVPRAPAGPYVRSPHDGPVGVHPP
eukprot:3741831-Pyramimonas_sp.AAC.1